ncbi:MAG: tetratricopeptide repeat protein [Opitutaceae bacterium]
MLCPLLAAGAASSADLNEAWLAIANSHPKDALRKLDESDPARAVQLARAVALMAQQSATDDNVRAAEKIFVELATGNDEPADEAAYLQARLYQLHYVQPDYAKAAELYQALAQRHPRSHWAQLGLVKLALLKLYVVPDTTAAGSDRLAPAEALLAQISDPLLQRDLNLQIGQAGVALKQPLARFLPHLVAADRVGGITATAREDLIVQIGVLSMRAGDWAQAKKYFERYLVEFPNNVRAYDVKLNLDDAIRHLAKRAGS